MTEKGHLVLQENIYTGKKTGHRLTFDGALKFCRHSPSRTSPELVSEGRNGTVQFLLGISNGNMDVLMEISYSFFFFALLA